LQTRKLDGTVPAVCGAKIDDGAVLNDENLYTANVGASSS